MSKHHSRIIRLVPAPLNTIKGWEAGKSTSHQSALAALLLIITGVPKQFR
jgi:hypothetical protein